MTVTGFKTIQVTATYVNPLSGAGETGIIEFVPSVPSLADSTDMEFLTLTPVFAILPGTAGGSPNSSGNGIVTVTLACTDNDEEHPASFTYTITERVTNMDSRVTTGVQIPSSLGSATTLTTILKPYI